LCACQGCCVVVVVVWVCWSSAPLAAVLLTLLLTFAFDPLIVAIRVLARDSPLRRQPNNEIASKALGSSLHGPGSRRRAAGGTSDSDELDDESLSTVSEPEAFESEQVWWEELFDLFFLFA
jgi:hypothetical protein